MVVSDNGASGEGGPNGSVNENLLFNGIPDDMSTSDPSYRSNSRTWTTVTAAL